MNNMSRVPANSQSSVVAGDGAELPIDSLPQSMSYNVDGTLQYVQVVYLGVTYRQSLTWVSGNVSTISAWEVV